MQPSHKQYVIICNIYFMGSHQIKITVNDTSDYNNNITLFLTSFQRSVVHTCA